MPPFRLTARTICPAVRPHQRRVVKQCACAAESGGWDAAARVAREGPLTSLQPALQECLECRVALLRQATAAKRAPATPPARKRSPFCDLRLEEIVLADLATAGLCTAEAARSACSVRRACKRQRMEVGVEPASPLAAPPAPPKLPQAPTATSTAWSTYERECEAEEGSGSEGTYAGSGDSCADDDELEDDAQSSSPTFSFQAWPAPRRGAPGHAGSMESTAGCLDCGQPP